MKIVAGTVWDGMGRSWLYHESTGSHHKRLKSNGHFPSVYCQVLCQCDRMRDLAAAIALTCTEPLTLYLHSS